VQPGYFTVVVSLIITFNRVLSQVDHTLVHSWLSI